MIMPGKHRRKDEVPPEGPFVRDDAPRPSLNESLYSIPSRIDPAAGTARSSDHVARVCNNCGHRWTVRRWMLGGRNIPWLLRNRAEGAIIASNYLKVDTCPKCGSVRNFRQG